MLGGAIVRTLSLAAILLIATASFGPARGAETLVLDESDYCRSRARFRAERISPASLRDAKLELLGQDLRRLKNEVKRAARMWRVKVTDENWQECYYPEIQWLQYGGSRCWADPYIESSAPPENWADPDFDDTRWLLQKQPIMVGPNGRGPGGDFYRKAIYTRYRFDVTDPAKAGPMKLNLIYVGGIRIFLNGTEIGRGHLPDGKLKESTPGADYPATAYVRAGKDGKIYLVKDRKAVAGVTRTSSFHNASASSTVTCRRWAGSVAPFSVRSRWGGSRSRARIGITPRRSATGFSTWMCRPSCSGEAPMSWPWRYVRRTCTASPLPAAGTSERRMPATWLGVTGSLSA